jgi:hypothetical protein
MRVRDEGFQPGHTLALVHGAYSPVEIKARAELVHQALLGVAPWLSDDRYLISVARYLDATAREQLAHEAVMARAPGSKGWTRLLETATAASRLAWRMGDELGLTPAGHARLQALVADAASAEQSLADLAAKGQAIIDAQVSDA